MGKRKFNRTKPHIIPEDKAIKAGIAKPSTGLDPLTAAIRTQLWMDDTKHRRTPKGTQP